MTIATADPLWMTLRVHAHGGARTDLSDARLESRAVGLSVFDPVTAATRLDPRSISVLPAVMGWVYTLELRFTNVTAAGFRVTVTLDPAHYSFLANWSLSRYYAGLSGAGAAGAWGADSEGDPGAADSAGDPGAADSAGDPGAADSEGDPGAAGSAGDPGAAGSASAEDAGPAPAGLYQFGFFAFENAVPLCMTSAGAEDVAVAKAAVAQAEKPAATGRLRSVHRPVAVAPNHSYCADSDAVMADVLDRFMCFEVCRRSSCGKRGDAPPAPPPPRCCSH